MRSTTHSPSFVVTHSHIFETQFHSLQADNYFLHNSLLEYCIAHKELAETTEQDIRNKPVRNGPSDNESNFRLLSIKEESANDLVSDMESLPGLETDYEILTPPSSTATLVNSPCSSAYSPCSSTYSPCSSAYSYRSSAYSLSSHASMPSLATCSILGSSDTLSPLDSSSSSDSITLNSLQEASSSLKREIRFGTSFIVWYEK